MFDRRHTVLVKQWALDVCYYMHGHGDRMTTDLGARSLHWDKSQVDSCKALRRFVACMMSDAEDVVHLGEYLHRPLRLH